MNYNKYSYKISVSYLGHRYLGWQKQKNETLTVQGRIEEATREALGGEFKTLGASRTDARVSAFKQIFTLTHTYNFEPEYIESSLNEMLPPDIRILEVERCQKNFRVINDVKIKEYIYFFSNHKTPSPFLSPLITNFDEPLNIEKMKQGASYFKGVHSFHNYVYKPNKDKIFVREVYESKIEEDKNYFGNIQGEKHFSFVIKSSGFMRHQIRIMMGALVNLGSGKTNLDLLEESLVSKEKIKAGFIAPASGLFLKNIYY